MSNSVEKRKANVALGPGTLPKFLNHEKSYIGVGGFLRGQELKIVVRPIFFEIVYTPSYCFFVDSCSTSKFSYLVYGQFLHDL